MPNPITRARLVELRAIHEAATPRPWKYIPPEERERRAAECELYKFVNDAIGNKTPQDEADSICTVESRNALPDLLDALEAAWDERERLHTELEFIAEVVNSWCREAGREECKTPYAPLALRDKIGSLWGHVNRKHNGQLRKLQSIIDGGRP